MSKAICPGSYDPFTLGHLNVVRRCALLFDEVTVLVAVNPEKHYFLSSDDRVRYIEDAIKELPNVRVEKFEGLLVDYALRRGADVIVKGLRGASDYTYEQEMASVNAEIALFRGNRRLETLFLPCAPEHLYTSSTRVRELMSLGAPVDLYVHDPKLLAQLWQKNR